MWSWAPKRSPNWSTGRLVDWPSGVRQTQPNLYTEKKEGNCETKKLKSN
jgi:hypothetical protein